MPMLTPAHIGKERYARTCVPGTPQGHHRHGRAKWYEGTNKGEQKTNKGEENACRRPRATEVKHNKKKKTQTKTKHTHVASRVQVCCMPRYATQRTRDKNGNHANKSKR